MGHAFPESFCVLVLPMVLAGVTAAAAPGLLHAQETVKIGFSATTLTGPFAENGKQMSTALKLFTEENGSEVAGRKIEVILRDELFGSGSSEAHRSGAGSRGKV